MKKVLLFAIFVLGSVASFAQLPAPTLSDADKVTKTDLWITVQARSADTSVKAFELQIDGRYLEHEKNSLNLGAFNVKNLLPGTSYTYRARSLGCLTSAGCTSVSPWTDWKTVTTQQAAPKKANITDTNTCPQYVGLNWSYAQTGGAVVSSHIVKSYGGPWYNVGYVTGSETSFYDLDVTPGMATRYAIVTYNALGEATWSDEVVVHVKAYTAPNPAQNLRVNNDATTTSSIAIVWNNGEEDQGCGSNIREAYYILVKRQFVADYEFWGVTYPYAGDYTINGLEETETVDIILRPLSNQGIWGADAHITAKTHGKSVKPSGIIGVSFTNNLGNSAIGVSWNHPGDDSDYYVVEYSTDGVKYTALGMVTNEVRVINHLNLSEGQPYTYRVKAGNYRYGESDYAYMDGYVETAFTSVPEMAYGLVGKLNGSTIELTWRDNSNKETKYLIEKSDKFDGTFVQVGEVGRNVTSYNYAIGNDTSSVFFFRVIAANTLGESEASNVAKVTKTTATTGGASGSLRVTTYPNPTVDVITVDFPAEIFNGSMDVKVYNQANQLVTSKKSKTGNTSLDLRKLPSGLYNVTITSGDVTEFKKIYKL